MSPLIFYQDPSLKINMATEIQDGRQNGQQTFGKTCSFISGHTQCSKMIMQAILMIANISDIVNNLNKNILGV